MGFPTGGFAQHLEVWWYSAGCGGFGISPRDVKLVSCVWFVTGLAGAVIEYDLVGWKVDVWSCIWMLHDTILWLQPE